LKRKRDLVLEIYLNLEEIEQIYINIEEIYLNINQTEDIKEMYRYIEKMNRHISKELDFHIIRMILLKFTVG